MAKFPTIADAKSLVKKYGLNGVIVIHFKGEQFGYVEYGQNKAWCKVMKRVADDIHDAIQNGEIALPGVETLLLLGGQEQR